MKFSIPIYFFTGLAAVSMACVAAFFSITGLAALYAAAAVPVIVMGSCIEFSKIVSTVWLHHFWKKSNFLMVGTLMIMVVASMAVTSGGVYGYLTGSHASQEAPNQQKQLIADRIDKQLAAEQDKITRYQDRLKSLDDIVSTSLTQGKYSSSAADRINRRQATERKQIQEEIDATYKRIDELSAQKLDVNQEQSMSEAKLGAVKYLAALFGADTSNAVMYFTLIMVLLLDPFAIILVIATQVAYDHRKKTSESVETQKSIGSETLDEIVEKKDAEEELPPSIQIDNDLTTKVTLEESIDHILPPDNIETIEDKKEKIVDFFNDDEIKDGINNAEDETIIRIDEVVNSSNISDDEKVAQVLNALGTTLSPDRMEEVKKRWLD